MDEDEAFDTGAISTEDEEIPDRLRSLIEEHLPNIRQVLIQVKKDGNWRIIKSRLRGVSAMEIDYVCSEVISIVRRHAEGSEADRLYRAKLEVQAADGTSFPRFATIKTKVGGNGEVDVHDGTEHEERTQLALLRDVMDSNTKRENLLFDKAMECLNQAQEQSRLTVAANTEIARAIGEMAGQYNHIGEGMQSLLVGVTGMITTGVELHSSHADTQAQVQIAKMEHESEDAKWALGLGLLGKIAAPLGGQIAASFGGKKNKKASVTQEDPKAVESDTAAANSDPTDLVARPAEPRKVGIVQPPEGWEVGRAEKTKTMLAKLTKAQRKVVLDAFGPTTLESFDEATESDELAAEILPVIRASIEQRLQENEYATHMQMARLSGSLGDQLTGELMDLLPPVPETT